MKRKLVLILSMILIGVIGSPLYAQDRNLDNDGLWDNWFHYQHITTASTRTGIYATLYCQPVMRGVNGTRGIIVMKIILLSFLGCIYFLYTLNLFLRGAKKQIIEGVLGALIFVTVIASFFLIGWRWGLVALISSFVLISLFLVHWHRLQLASF